MIDSNYKNNNRNVLNKIVIIRKIKSGEFEKVMDELKNTYDAEFKQTQFKLRA